jgi:thiamine biosynthesis lipoprotein
VLAPTAVEADALATGVFVMGPDSGLALVDTLPKVEAMVTAPDLARHTSSRFPPLVEPEDSR